MEKPATETELRERQEKALAELADLLDLDEGLSSWEVNFIDSLSHWRGDFTPKQVDTIKVIYDKHFG